MKVGAYPMVWEKMVGGGEGAAFGSGFEDRGDVEDGAEPAERLVAWADFLRIGDGF